jgi:hypothetical protein
MSRNASRYSAASGLKKIFSRDNKTSVEKVFDSIRKSQGSEIKSTDVEIARITARTPTLQMRYMIDDYEELFGKDAGDL